MGDLTKKEMVVVTTPKSVQSEFNEDNLREMMNDPRYWKDRDPEFVQQVRDGFKALYPECDQTSQTAQTDEDDNSKPGSITDLG